MKLKNLSRRALTLLLILASLSWAACSDAKELLDLALSPPGRKPLQRDLIGLNSFFVNSAEFGSIDHQYQDITQNLKLKHLRVLFAWTDAVQASPNVAPN